ncbi:MAG: 2-C-methyl-D-erythritol 4-phosphate cytidylyltransferase [Candidatus Cloacimonetes bacterium]|nr:2-C-methyl-D-erythritol 4-phosphate cytidylyltransferase [Candidatus Cloacimonadota bacterium]
MKISCIITAGGKGSRFSNITKKQFYLINKKPILELTIDVFHKLDIINNIIITLPEDEYFKKNNDLTLKYPKKVSCVIGGVNRQQSVFNALTYCPEDTDLVLIHDGVRPFIEESEILNLIEIAKTHQAVIPGNKVKNTIKSVKDNKIINTIERNNLIEVYTPQVFNYHLIYESHKKIKEIQNTEINFTDDASILEYFNIPVYWYESKSNNLKITTQEDIKYAKYLLENKEFI